MTRRISFLLFCFFLFCGLVRSQSSDPVLQLKLVPAPREVHLGDGGFVVSSATRIVLSGAHVGEERVAAEMLAEEILSQSGLKVPVESSREAAKASGAIVLGRLDDRGLRATLEAKGLKAGKDFDGQGYLLLADKARIIVAGPTGQGLFYGVQTLRQLLRPEGKRLIVPAVFLKDWPAMKWRGVHDDVSRGPIPTLDYMKKQVRTLAAYKVNLFALYMEHVFDYQSQPLIAPKEAALTPAGMKELVEYAKKYYVTILPEQQAFGHLHHVLKYEIYSELAETPHGHVLTPTKEQSYDLIKSLYAELAPLFPGELFHIGSDETFELGIGQTKARAAAVGLGRVYLEHLQKVYEIMKPYHKRLMFWGDIAVKYPQLLSILPKDMIAVPWDYDARPSFEEEVKPFRDAGLDVFVASGANNWNRIWPNLDVAFVNIRNFVRDGQKYGALGMLNTTWDDDGESLFEMTWPAMVFGAAAGWQPGESNIDAFKQSYDWAFYRNSDSSFRDAIENLDRANALLAGVGLGSARDDLFWADPFSEVGAHVMQKAEPAARDLRLAAEHALESLYRNRGKARAQGETLDALLLAGWRLDTLGMKIQFTREINQFYWDAYLNQTDAERVGRDLDEISGINARLEDLRDATTRVRGLYEKAWLRENHPYWLGNVLVRYDNLASEFEAKIVAVQEAQAQYWTRKTLPPPQQLGFFLKPE